MAKDKSIRSQWARSAVLALLLVALPVGCASEPPKPEAPLLPGQVRVLREAHLSTTGFNDTILHTGSTWRGVGDIAQGHIFKPVDTVLSVDDGGYFNGARYEAEIVVKGGQVVGLYLPTEKKFLAAKKAAANCLTGAVQ